MTQQIRTFSLCPLMAENSRLILNDDLGILSELAGEEILEQQLLSPSEMYLIEALLKNYPEYCPYEVVLSAMTGRASSSAVKRCCGGLKKGPLTW